MRKLPVEQSIDVVAHAPISGPRHLHENVIDPKVAVAEHRRGAEALINVKYHDVRLPGQLH